MLPDDILWIIYSYSANHTTRWESILSGGVEYSINDYVSNPRESNERYLSQIGYLIHKTFVDCPEQCTRLWIAEPGLWTSRMFIQKAVRHDCGIIASASMILFHRHDVGAKHLHNFAWYIVKTVSSVFLKDNNLLEIPSSSTGACSTNEGILHPLEFAVRDKIIRQFSKYAKDTLYRLIMVGNYARTYSNIVHCTQLDARHIDAIIHERRNWNQHAALAISVSQISRQYNYNIGDYFCRQIMNIL